MKTRMLLACAALLAFPAQAAEVLVDLSGATTGTSIVVSGASFAQTFAGQTVAGTGVTGSPTDPLTLAAAGTLTVQFWDPGVSSASNSLFSQPGNTSPLSILFDSLADSLTFTAGFGDPPSSLDFSLFDASGALTGSGQIALLSGYNIYSISGLGTFQGLTFFNNSDPAGLRFQNFSYNSIAAAVPEPGTWAMLLIGFGGIGIAIRRRKPAVLRALA